MVESRLVSDSLTVQTYILLPSHMNASGSVFGGQLLSWIDMTAGIVAMRHADHGVVTASIDRLDFKEGAQLNDVITLEGRISWVGKCSMEVRVDTYKENKGGKKHLINTAYLVMVALDDETRRPTPVPRLKLVSAEDLAEWEAGEKRVLLRRQRLAEGY